MTTVYELGEASREIVKAFIQRVICDAAPVQEPDLADKVAEEFGEFLGKLPRLYRVGMVGALRLLDVGPMALGYRHTFLHLSESDQLKYLNHLETSRNYALRGLIMALKSIAILIFFSEPAVTNAVGYDGLCLLKAESKASIN